MLTELFCCASLVMSATDTLPPPPPPPIDENQLFTHYERQPEIMLCDSLENVSERKRCMTERIVKIIYSHLEYPKEAKEKELEGVAVVAFTITKEGRFEDFQIVRDPGLGTGEEALRVVKILGKETAPWHPGTLGRDRKPVDVRIMMPVKFKLE